jgi:pimeloyl-ACP methyl ester carboxylesterase
MLLKPTLITCVALGMIGNAATVPEPQYVPLYQTLPATPKLPASRFEGTARINNIQLWYGLYGPPMSPSRTPLVFLHGGKISSKWWGHQIDYATRKGHTVIAVDTRAHGRSSDNLNVPLSYDLFADDLAALLEFLKVPRASIVGWSDGANTALSMAMLHGDKVDRIFAFGANYRPDQANTTGIPTIPFLQDLFTRMKTDYKALSSTPGSYATFVDRVGAMQAQYPSWDSKDFAKIKTLYQDPARAPIVWIVDGDSEEIVLRRVPGELRDMIWGSSLVLLPDVGHFAPLQDPGTFNVMIDRWLSRR